jgi:DNA repair protein RadC
MSTIHSDPAATYAATHDDQSTIDAALAILNSRIRARDVMSSPADTRAFLRLHLEAEPCEFFGVLYLDNRNRLIAFERPFRGTIDGASVHPREIVRDCISHNAAAVIIAHNHPSGVAEPSVADQALTRRLKDALALIDVRVLDHIVVGAGEMVSFAERGLL